MLYLPIGVIIGLLLFYQNFGLHIFSGLHTFLFGLHNLVGQYSTLKLYYATERS